MHYPTLLHDYFDESVRKFPQKEALIFEDQRFTYSDLYHQAHTLADQLIDMGLVRQQRVLIYMDNAPAMVISPSAILKGGRAFTIINSAVPVQKLSYIIGDCQPSVIIADSRKKQIIGKALANQPFSCQLVWTGSDIDHPVNYPGLKQWQWNELVHFPPSENRTYQTHQFARVLDIDLAGLIYTSGSTGDPKGVMESHRNIISAAQSIIQYLENTPDDILLNTLPLSFDYGLYQLIMSMMFGGTLILEKSFIFLSRTLKIIQEEKVTGFPIVPTIVAMIFKTIDLKSFDLNTLRYLTNTGAAFPVEHIKKLRALLPHVNIYSMFGLTECKRIAYLPPKEIDSRPDSVGKAMPNCEVFIVDENEKPVINGEKGELVVRGANVMQGYWNAPEQTAQTFREALGYREKLLFTGDYFQMDAEGFLYFLGRKDDMIKSRGERISAKEIENIINQVEGVNECAVIGVEDEILGQAVKAFVVPNPQITLKKKEILTHCANNLEPYSIPKYIEIIPEMPKTTHGKTDKKTLKQNNKLMDPSSS